MTKRPTIPPCPPKLSTCLIHSPKAVTLKALPAEADVVAAGLDAVLVAVLSACVRVGSSVGS